MARWRCPWMPGRPCIGGFIEVAADSGRIEAERWSELAGDAPC